MEIEVKSLESAIRELFHSRLFVARTHVRLSRFEYRVVRVGVSKTPPPPVSKVKLPSAAGAVKNHVLNVFGSGRHF